jgi:PST family polysaccharide transporter
MTLVRDTVRGAMWTILAGVMSRTVGLAGTLFITRFVDPADYGEVTVAAVVVMTANQVSTVGFGQFLIAKPEAPRGVAFHATALHVGFGVLAAALVVSFAGRLAPALDAPRMMRFVPGLVLSGLLDRVGYVPERVLVRDLRFRVVSLARTAGDVAYSVGCVSLAIAGAGGMAIVLGNVVRSLARSGAFVLAAERRDWLEPCRPSTRTVRELFGFGLPMSAGALCAFAARRWDNLLVSRFFGPGPTGMYNLAYNLADVPAIQIGEQIGDTLLPSFARMDGARRPEALVRAIGLLALVVFPLAVGLGAVGPTLVATLFDARWRPLGPMLVLLSALSVTRPVGWMVESYLQARRLPGLILGLEALKVVALVLFIVTFGRRSPIWTCGAVGLAFAGHALASLWVIRKVDGISLRRSVGSLVPPLLACVPMVLAVLATREALAACNVGAGRPAFRLLVEVTAGATGYLAAAFVVARDQSKDLVARVTDAVRSRA